MFKYDNYMRCVVLDWILGGRKVVKDVIGEMRVQIVCQFWEYFYGVCIDVDYSFVIFFLYIYRYREKGFRIDQKDQKCVQNWDLSRSVMVSGRGVM